MTKNVRGPYDWREFEPLPVIDRKGNVVKGYASKAEQAAMQKLAMVCEILQDEREGYQVLPLPHGRRK